MQNNPLYHYLVCNKGYRVETTAVKKKKYVKFQLPSIHEKNKTIFLNKNKYSIDEHHLSIYETYTKDDVFSPIHYTIGLSGEKRIEKCIKAHVYFDEGGNYLSCTAKNLDSGASVKLSDEDKESFRKVAEYYSRLSIDSQMNLLVMKQDSIKKIKDTCLQELEEESKKGTAHRDYKEKLASVIKILEEEAKYLFSPDVSVMRFLERYREKLKESNASSARKKKNKKTLSESKDDHLEQSSLFSQPVYVSEKKKSITPEALIDRSLTLSQKLSLELGNEKIDLYKELDTCDLNRGFEIFKKIDDLEKRMVDILYQACIDGDLDLVKKYFNSEIIKTGEGLNKLLSTCVYHNKQDLFEYIYNNIKNHFVKHYLFVNPYEALNRSTDMTKFNAFSFLEIAFLKRNIEFFKKLLTTFHYDPNLMFVEGQSLLSKIICAGENDYAAALLKAGADPDTVGVHKRVGYAGEFANGVRLQSHGMENKEAEEKSLLARTPLHHAVIKRNVEAVKLLLLYKADPYRVASDDFNVWGYALLTQYGSDRVPVSKDIIAILMKHGFKIDDSLISQESVTGLFLACQNNDLDAVKIFLEYKADPSAKHQQPIEIHGEESGVITTTPLLVALFKNHADIVNYLLNNCVFSIEELSDCYEQCTKYGRVKAIGFIETYLKDEAVRLHKEGKAGNDKEKLNSAEKYYKKVLELTRKPEITHQVYYNLGACLLEKGERDRAVEHFRHCLSLRLRLAGHPVKNTPELRALIDKVSNKISELDPVAAASNLTEKDVMDNKTDQPNLAASISDSTKQAQHNPSYVSTGALGLFAPLKREEKDVPESSKRKCCDLTRRCVIS